ncbi:MAG: hypothetical protein JRJ84_13255 [Deltaproteobacteria bacterium]|nr:hypothetical protein [Deltaproteobacteria bacterium]
MASEHTDPGQLRIVVEGTAYAHNNPCEWAQLDKALAGYFGEAVTIEHLIAVFEVGDLHLDTLRFASRGAELFETRATFSSTPAGVYGTFTNPWRRGPLGRLTRLPAGRLFISGSRSRLALQLHANLAEFARLTGLVDAVEVQALDVGRYAYRFMHGVEVDAATRAALYQRLRQAEDEYHFGGDVQALDTLRSPRDLCDYRILSRLTDPWVAEVDAIIERHGYRFSVDQVVDVARRPGLAYLIDRASYSMRLEVRDPVQYEQFRESVRQARTRRSLPRLTGVLGSAFHQLPPGVRAVLLTCRPFLFPQPRKTPPLPDLSDLEQPVCPYPVLGFDTADGAFLPAAEPDPQGVPLRGYRAAEVAAAAEAVRDGARVVTVTGLSASGKTEIFIWNLERALAAAGHEAVSLDAQRFVGRDDAGKVLRQLDELLDPTVLILDESVYLRGVRKAPVVRFIERFLQWSDRHVFLVGGGRTSPQAQRASIEEQLESLFRMPSAHVSLYPKPLNLVQAYRFLGLARLDWASEEQRRDLLCYTLQRIPPHFLSLLPVQFHEHPHIRDMDRAKSLIDEEVTPDDWSELVGMVLGAR